MNAAAIVEAPSPNHGPRPPGPVDMLILHYTGMRSGAAALARLRDPAAAVSAHYLVDEDGAVARLVPEERRAWHAGRSSWRGREDINGASIGIEIVNPGHDLGYRPFPAPQMAALAALCRAILDRHPIPPRHVLAHADVAPRRKRDPGELFDWRALARHGIGLWPAAASAPGAPACGCGDGGRTVAALQAALAAFGYAVAVDGRFGVETAAVVRAFQRHFRPWRVDGRADGETGALLAALLAQCDEPLPGAIRHFSLSLITSH